MNRAERGKWLEEQVEDAIADLEHELNQGHTDVFLSILDFYSRFYKYSLANTILILIQKPEATYCAGFRKWEEMGHKVRKGEQAIWIRAPNIKKETDPQTGEIVEWLIGYFGVPIFDISQIDGEVELPDVRPGIEGDYFVRYIQARAAMGAEGIMVDEEPLPTDIHGMSFGSRVVISPTLPDSGKFLTLLHEWGHEVLNHVNRHEEVSKAQRELCAESVSYLLAKLYGLENPYSRDYILNWEGTVELLHDSLTEIHFAVKKIADALKIEPKDKAEAA